jgi:hypothetical protein
MISWFQILLSNGLFNLHRYNTDSRELIAYYKFDTGHEVGLYKWVNPV